MASAASYFQLTADPIALDWSQHGDRLLHLVYEELVAADPRVTGWGGGGHPATPDEPNAYYGFRVSGSNLVSELCAFPTVANSVFLAIRANGELSRDQVTPWLDALSKALARFDEDAASHDWWAVIMAASILGPPVRLDSEQVIADMRLTPSTRMHNEIVDSFMPSLQGGQLRSGWPVVISGASLGYSRQVADEAAANRIGRLCAVLSVATDACWEIREAPRPYELDPDTLPTSRTQSGESLSIPTLEAAEVLSLPEWVGRALQVLDDSDDLLTAVRAHHQAMMMETKFPSFSLLGYVAAIEGIGARYAPLKNCERCGGRSGAERRFRKALGIVMTNREKRPLIDLYRQRSETAHEGRLHGGEDMFGAFPGGRMVSEHQAQFFRFGHLRSLRIASKALLTLGLTEQLPPIDGAPQAREGGCASD